jgi:periplasmic copper chaperone A
MKFVVQTFRCFAAPAAFGVALIGASAFSMGACSADITVQKAWALATPPKATVGRAFMKIVNSSAEADHLVSVTAEVARSAEISGIRLLDNAPRMRQLMNLDVPAGGSVEFTPGGYHVLLRNLKKPLAPGDTFKGTLTFERTGVISVEYKVEAADPSSTPGQ